MSEPKLPDVREDLHGVVPYERQAPPLSLYDADPDQVQLFALREECQTDEERAEIDKPLKAYVESELEKVTPLTALFVCFKNNAAAGRADEERIQKDRARWQTRYDLLKSFVYDSMIQRGKELVTSAAARFRLQDNPVQLEVTDEKLVPLEYMRATVTLSWDEWQRMRLLCEQALNLDMAIPPIAIEEIRPSVNAQALKAALLVKVKCPDCEGTRSTIQPICPACAGSGVVPATVPGARLKKGQHLRIE